jgi:hypothetical protein
MHLDKLRVALQAGSYPAISPKTTMKLPKAYKEWVTIAKMPAPVPSLDPTGIFFKNHAPATKRC